MLILKKIPAVLLALASHAIFAGTMGSVCDAVDLTLPCVSNAWEIGASVLFLQPSIGDSNFGGTRLISSTTVNYANLDQKWAWSFKLDGAYYFNTGNDINLNWYHLSRLSEKSYKGDLSFFSGETTTDSSWNTNPTWNAVNVEMGQLIDLNENYNVRFHGGAQYAHISNDIALTGTGDNGVVFDQNLQHSTTYNGFGPRFGTDLSYAWENGYGIYAKGAAALLVGNLGFNDSFTTTSTISSTLSEFRNGSLTTIVPAIDAKLGVTYNYMIAQSDLALDVGWMWVNYFNAQQSIDRNYVLGAGGEGHENNFGVQGLMIELKWMVT